MRTFVLVLIASLCAVSPGLYAKPVKPTKTGDDGSTPFQGVWEQVSLQRHDGNLEEKDPQAFDDLKLVAIWIGRKCYWVGSTLPGVKMSLQEAYFHADGGANNLDLVSPDDNATSRHLYRLEGDTWTSCCNIAGKGLKRPEKIAPVANEVDVSVFKRLPGPAKRPAVNKGPFLSGLWETVGFELNGVKLEEQKEQRTFRQNEKIFFFQDGVYTMLSAKEFALVITHKPYELKPKASKEAIDFTDIDGKVVEAIYKRDGDTLTICWCHRGPRPEQFATAPGDGRAVVRLKRVDR
jgi:uncharacterized protein (TIGR03067 family)